MNEICRRANVKCPLQDLLNRVDPEMEDDAKDKVKRGANTAAVKRFMDDRRDKTKKEIDEKISEGAREGPMIIEEVEEDVKEKSTSPRRLDRLFSAEDNDELKIEEVEVEDDDEIEVEEKVEDDEIEIEEKVEDKEKDVNDMSVKELKALIRSARLKWNDCREKSELRERAREAREKLKNGGDDDEEGDPDVPEEFKTDTKIDDEHLEAKSDSGDSNENAEENQQQQQNDFDQYLPPRFRRQKMPFSQWWRRQLKIAALQFVGIFVMMLISSLLGYGPLWEPEDTAESQQTLVDDVLDDEVSFDHYVEEL